MTGRIENIERYASQIVDSALEVHKVLGAGLLESVYETALCHELESRSVAFERQAEVPLIYKGQTLNQSLRLDLLVAGCIVIEIKSVKQMEPVFQSQILTYMRLGGFPMGFLINFNVPLIKNGISRYVL